jgi:cytochrome b6-f complex iron-sulfur subunit
MTDLDPTGGDPPGERKLDQGRRRFVNWFLGTALGALFVSIAYPVLRYLSPPRLPEASTNQVDAGPVNDPELLDQGFKILRFGDQPVILIRVSQNDFRAFSAVCTHLECIVTYRKDRRLIWCYCHNGVYNLKGINIAGPPPRPLTPYKVHIVAGKGERPDSLVVQKA